MEYVLSTNDRSALASVIHLSTSMRRTSPSCPPLPSKRAFHINLVCQSLRSSHAGGDGDCESPATVAATAKMTTQVRYLKSVALKPKIENWGETRCNTLRTTQLWGTYGAIGPKPHAPEDTVLIQGITPQHQNDDQSHHIPNLRLTCVALRVSPTNLRTFLPHPVDNRVYGQLALSRQGYGGAVAFRYSPLHGAWFSRSITYRKTRLLFLVTTTLLYLSCKCR